MTLKKLARPRPFVIEPLTDPEVQEALFGRQVESVVGELHGCAVAIRTLGQITDLPQSILRKKWGDAFEAYCLVPCHRQIVEGLILSIDEREHGALDRWYMVGEGWHRTNDDAYARVGNCAFSNVRVDIITQTPAPGQLLSRTELLRPLMPQAKTISIARSLREPLVR